MMECAPAKMPLSWVICSEFSVLHCDTIYKLFICLGEIETLQRCAALHSWNVQFWFSLALAYEKASVSSCKLCQDEDVTIVKGERICSMKHNPAVENCTKMSLNGEYQSREGCYTCTKKCHYFSTENQTQHLTPREPYCMGERQIRHHMENMDFKGQVSPVSRADKKAELQDQSLSCLHKVCPDSLDDDSVLALFSSNEKSLQEECARKRLKWRNHVLSFGSLVKTRFFLEKSMEASSSFAKEKSSTLLTEVNSKIATHAECGCAQLIDKVLEMLYSSVVASGQMQLDQEKDDIKLKELSTESVTNSVDFEQKWFGDLLFYMDTI